jgi:flagellar motor switch protein FliG
MSATVEPTSAPVVDYARLTPPQKLAALLLMLGAESASQVLKQLDEAEVEAVSAELAKGNAVSQELQGEILREFAGVVLEAATSIRGGADFTQTALEKGLGAPKAATILNKVAPARLPPAAVQRLAELEPDQIFNVLKQERPQTIALVASCLPPQRASQVLGLLPAELRGQVVERLATLGPAPVETVERIVEVLLQKTGARQSRALSQTGGLKAAATVLNALDKKLSQALLTALEERNPELGQAIRQKMFTFDDLSRLDTVALQRILREVDLRDLAIALKSASEHLKAALLGCISKRAAETVNEEMSFLGAIKVREVEAAQLRIISVLRRLETEGEIDLGDAQDQSAAGGAKA